MNNENTWWYMFDPSTYAYTGMILADVQPENTTDVAPGDVANPVWDPTLKTWNGEDINDKLDDLNSDNENIPLNIQIANLSSELETIKQDVAELKNK